MGKRIRRIFTLISALAVATAIAAVNPACAQNSQIDRGNGMMGANPDADTGMNSIPGVQGNETPDGMATPRLGSLEIRQPVTGTMMVSPPYGSAPLKVGFFVVASDPEDIGFLTYQWNFGDGTVSSLPPEKYIPHIYKKPGNYVCSLTLKTVDGRSKTIFTGVVVRHPTD